MIDIAIDDSARPEYCMMSDRRSRITRLSNVFPGRKPYSYRFEYLRPFPNYIDTDILSFHSHALCKVSWLVNIPPEGHSSMVREELFDNKAGEDLDK